MGSVLGLVTSERILMTIVSLVVSIFLSFTIVNLFRKKSFQNTEQEGTADFTSEPVSKVDIIIISILAGATLFLIIAAYLFLLS